MTSALKNSTAFIISNSDIGTVNFNLNIWENSGFLRERSVRIIFTKDEVKTQILSHNKLAFLAFHIGKLLNWSWAKKFAEQHTEFKDVKSFSNNTFDLDDNTNREMASQLLNNCLSQLERTDKTREQKGREGIDRLWRIANEILDQPSEDPGLSSSKQESVLTRISKIGKTSLIHQEVLEQQSTVPKIMNDSSEEVEAFGYYDVIPEIESFRSMLKSWSNAEDQDDLAKKVLEDDISKFIRGGQLQHQMPPLNTYEERTKLRFEISMKNTKLYNEIYDKLSPITSPERAKKTHGTIKNFLELHAEEFTIYDLCALDKLAALILEFEVRARENLLGEDNLSQKINAIIKLTKEKKPQAVDEQRLLSDKGNLMKNCLYHFACGHTLPEGLLVKSIQEADKDNIYNFTIGIEHMFLYNPQISAKMISQFLMCASPRSQYEFFRIVNQAQVTIGFLKHVFYSLPQELTRLELNFSSVVVDEKEIIMILSRLKNLKTLNLVCCGFTDKFIIALAQNRDIHLTHLDLSNCDRLTDKAFEALDNAYQGKELHLNFAYCRNISDTVKADASKRYPW